MKGDGRKDDKRGWSEECEQNALNKCIKFSNKLTFKMMVHSLLMCLLIVSYYMSGVMLKTWGIKWIAKQADLCTADK